MQFIIPQIGIDKRTILDFLNHASLRGGERIHYDRSEVRDGTSSAKAFASKSWLSSVRCI